MEAVSALALAAMLSGGADTSVDLIIKLNGNIERNIVQYQCDDEQSLTVEYINAAPTFLAMLDAGGGQTIFVNVMSGSGARYVSGQYEWFTKGTDATFTDLMADEGTGSLTCSEFSETP
jgi:membrane-bound inhibitor of C-type lysozyme